MKWLVLVCVIVVVLCLGNLSNGCPEGYNDITPCLSWMNDTYGASQGYCYEGRTATTQDAASIGLITAYANWISDNIGAQCSYPFPAVSYDDTSLADLACVTQGSAYVTDTQENDVQTILVEQKFVNQGNQNVSYTFGLQTTFTNEQTYEVIQESSFSLSDTLSFSVDAFGFSFGNSYTLSTGVSNTESQTSQYSTQQQISESPVVNIPPGACVQASINGNVTQLTGTISVPSILNGPIRCDFGSPVCGHYYWVGNMNNCGSTAMIGSTVGLLVSFSTVLVDCNSGEVLYEKEHVLIDRDN